MAFLPFNRSLTGADQDNTPPFPFPPLGMVAGCLFVLSVTFSFAAIPYIGLAMAQGVWGGSAILVAWIWGVAVFGNTIHSPGLAAAAIILLTSGVIGIAFCQNIADYFSPYQEFKEKHAAPLRGSADEDEEAKSLAEKDYEQKSNTKKMEWLTGMGFAAAVGLAGGSTLVPLNYVPKNESGLAFLPAFGVGAIIFSPLLCAGWFLYEGQIPPLHFKETFWAGVCQIIAIPALSYSVAYPILQCALFVAGLWGIFVFKEIRDRAVLVFFISGAVMLSGATCLLSFVIYNIVTINLVMHLTCTQISSMCSDACAWPHQCHCLPTPYFCMHAHACMM
mmetsp:Transcript_19851/g.48567  ORF Transcript_19851/g.48567 Transcript_19851/m.48567 type:complete len:334 (-) Transcript_19851:624-1625(-)